MMWWPLSAPDGNGDLEAVRAPVDTHVRPPAPAFEELKRSQGVLVRVPGQCKVVRVTA